MNSSGEDIRTNWRSFAKWFAFRIRLGRRQQEFIGLKRFTY